MQLIKKEILKAKSLISSLENDEIVKQLLLQRENLTVELTALKSEKTDAFSNLEKCNEDIALAEKRKASDEGLFENLKHQKEVKALQTELDRLDSRLSELADKKQMLKSDLDNVNEKIHIAESNFLKVSEQIENSSSDKQSLILEQTDNIKLLENDFETKKSSLSEEVLSQFESSLEQNYGRAVVFYKDGNFEGILQPLTPKELSEIKAVKDDEIYILEETGQLVVKASGFKI